MQARLNTVHLAKWGQPFRAAAAHPRGAPGRNPAAGQKARPHKVNSIASSLHFSHSFVARRVRRPWIRGARSSARGSILEQYVEHGERAQRSRHGLIARRSRRSVRNAG